MGSTGGECADVCAVSWRQVLSEHASHNLPVIREFYLRHPQFLLMSQRRQAEDAIVRTLREETGKMAFQNDVNQRIQTRIPLYVTVSPEDELGFSMIRVVLMRAPTADELMCHIKNTPYPYPHSHYFTDLKQDTDVDLDVKFVGNGVTVKASGPPNLMTMSLGALGFP